MTVRRNYWYLFGVIALLLIPATATPVLALEDTVEDGDGGGAYNFIGWFFLLVALFGWSIFLGLLGTAIYMVVRKSKGAYVVRNPVRCK